MGGGTLSCNDLNPCTADSCKPGVGCEFLPTDADCDDGNECTVQDKCSGGICTAGAMADCDDGTVCTKDWCDPVDGCQHDPLEGPCSDGTDCTLGDSCQNGVCVSGPLLDCEDGNPCTDDACDPLLGCQNVPNEAPCTDDDLCTVNDFCSDGECLSGEAKDCDDENICTTDSCAPKIGCVFALNNLECDDGNDCTENDTCGNGECVGGPQVDCDDGNPCTNDTCNPGEGCIHAEFAPCCGNGVLEPGEECDDGNWVGGDGCEEDCTEFTDLNVTFTNCGKTGPIGPSQNDCNNAYSGVLFLKDKVTLNGGVQRWSVPFTGTYRIEAYGAKGGSNGGNGARMRGDFDLTKDEELLIVVGHQGLPAPAQVGNGGGGGTFVVKANGNTPLIIAAGGGGTGHNSAYPNHSVSIGKTGPNGSAGLLGQAGAGGTNGNGGKESYTTGNGTPNGAGGGGLLTDGGSSGSANGGKSFLNGCQGGNSTGGYGGGGGTNHFVYGCGSSPPGGSGGGGYSGGGAGGDNCNGPGGGGGSYNDGANQSNSEGANGGHGKVSFLRL